MKVINVRIIYFNYWGYLKIIKRWKYNFQINQFNQPDTFFIIYSSFKSVNMIHSENLWRSSDEQRKRQNQQKCVFSFFLSLSKFFTSSVHIVYYFNCVITQQQKFKRIKPIKRKKTILTPWERSQDVQLAKLPGFRKPQCLWHHQSPSRMSRTIVRLE